MRQPDSETKPCGELFSSGELRPYGLVGNVRSLGRAALISAGLVITYVLVAELSRRIDFVHENARVFLPQAGVGLAGLVLFGARYWPAVAIGSLLVNWRAGADPALMFGFAVGNSAGAAAGALLLERVGQLDPRMERLRDVVAFSVLGGLGAPLISALTGILVYALLSAGPWIETAALWGHRVFGHVTSVLAVSPALLVAWRRGDSPERQGSLREAACAGALLLLVCVYVFTGQSPLAGLNYPFTFAPFPLLIWIAWRFGPAGASLAVLAIAGISTFGTSRGYGPFVQTAPEERLLLLQLYLATVALSGLLLASATAERNRALRDLTDSQNRLRALSARLQTAREEERTQVSREIHDELGQVLTSLRMGVHAVIRKLPENAPVAIERCQSLLGMTEEASGAVRRIAASLRPGILDDLGLVEALQWQAAEFEKQTGLAVHFLVSGEEPPLSLDRKTALFRVLQESLTNVARHAEADSVTVTVSVEQAEVVLTVQDNGVGISPRRLQEVHSLGVLGMRERMELIGGRLELTSRDGTLVRASVSLKDPLAEGERE